MNFGLRIHARRPDGYHELESVFVPLDLADALCVEVAEAPLASVELRLDPPAPGVPEGAENLAVRAAQGFLDAAGLVRALRLGLRKQVPAAAGLGGGSSDAGAVLRGLAELFPAALAAGELERIALELGADVPFFLRPAPALVSGIGERREPLPAPLPPLLLLLANPGQALPTAAVYAAFDALTPAPAPRPLRPDLEAALARPDDGALAKLLHNDLEAAALRLCPALARLRRGLSAAGARVVGLSGSGATVFGVFRDLPAAEAARQRLLAGASPGTWARVARTAEAG